MGWLFASIRMCLQNVPEGAIVAPDGVYQRISTLIPIVIRNVKMYRLVTVLLCAMAGVVAFAQTKAIVKPGDNVNVVCEEEPSLSKDYTITRDGYIVMQFIGAVNIAGLDEPTAGAKLAATLIEQRILPKANIKLKILGTKTALIGYGGAVTRSGELFPRKGLRLSDVVAVAHPTSAANMERVRIITADGKELAVNFKSFDGTNEASNPELRAGDRVFFDLLTRPQDVMVTGEVSKPGIMGFKEGMTVRQAVSNAGGVRLSGDPKTVRVEHAGQIKEVDITKNDAPLQPGDRVIVSQMTVLTYVNVDGAVQTPRRVPFREGLTLGQVVEAAGGAHPKADLGKVQIIRKVDGKDKVTNHDLAAVYASRAGDVPLSANDRVVVNMPNRKGKKNDVLRVVGALVFGAMFGILKF